MDMLNILYATIATIIVISPFVIIKIRNSRKGIRVYNSPPTKTVGDKTGIFKKVY